MQTLPGLIDCHVHFREPGLVHKATIASEAAAARSGGIFAVCEMPNTMPPTNSIARFQEKVERANAVRDVCDVRFFFGATSLSHLKELEELFAEEKHKDLARYCCGLKLYLDNSTGDMKSSNEVNEAAFALCAKLGITLVAHCEHAATNDEAAASIPYSGPLSHSMRRPAKSEVASIREAIDLARTHKTRLHIAHLSTAGGLQLVREAKKEGLPVSCEVSPHHLMLSTADYSVLGNKGKVNPPLRGLEEREALWAGVVSGDVDCIATDHAPHLLSEKEGNAEQQKDSGFVPPSGLPGVEVSLALLLSTALGHWPHPTDPRPAASEGFSLDHIRRLMYEGPNKVFNMHCADTPRLRVEQEGTRTIKGEQHKTKCHWTPYEGWVVKGDVKEI